MSVDHVKLSQDLPKIKRKRKRKERKEKMRKKERVARRRRKTSYAPFMSRKSAFMAKGVDSSMRNLLTSLTPMQSTMLRRSEREGQK